ncbi:MAG: glycosyltransferase, partial [Fusobacteriaceae bacterium]
LSSKDEGFGLVIVEALYLNGNVISSDCYIGPSEILQRGMLGELFDVGNKNNLSNLLCQPPTRRPLQDGQLDIYRADSSVLMLHKVISGISNAID